MKTIDLARLMLFVPLLALTACRTYEHDDRFIDLERVEKPPAAAAGTVNVHFLGTGGIYVEGEGVNLLADPFFTNPWLVPNVLLPVPTSSDAKIIDRELKRFEEDKRLEGLQGILVTHAHYDHAMDIPYIARKHVPVCVYGSETVRNSLGADLRARFCSLEGKIVDPTQSRMEWVRVAPRVRIAAIQAQHFDHAFGIMYADGHYAEPRADAPSTMHGWRVGDTYSYVIDIMSAAQPAQVAFRIFYMPSAAMHPIGTPPAAMLDDGKRVDLAILGASQLEKDPAYPGALLRRMQPKAVMMVHWDYFFDRYRRKNVFLNYKVEPAEIAARITEAIGVGPDVYWPERGAVKNFALAVPSGL